jgi:DNA polymerase III subunit gamma/tau
VVESFREKYVLVGQAADPAFLISSLNLLGEAEINYKAARNKRLHVELALIKLCYLGQALNRNAVEPDGKKRAVGHSRPVSFRNIPAMELASVKKEEGMGVAGTGAKLLVETPAEKEALPPGTTPAVDNTAAGNKTPDPVQVPTAKPSLGSLSKIRQQFSSRLPDTEGNSSAVLEAEALFKAWTAYTQQLREAKNHALQSFERATLKIVSGQSFEVISNNNLEQKFIEQEKRSLSDFLQKAFSNKAISFTIVVQENDGRDEPVEKQLNKREQFLRIAEQYPLVKELKDRLRLELDY